MRYFINFDRLVNQIVPYYLGGRKLILFLQSIVSPLQSLNDNFAEWGRERRIEASMTSQIFKLEWFLNRKFSCFFLNTAEKITISNSTNSGVALYYQDANSHEDPVIYTQSEYYKSNTDFILYRTSESPDMSSYSFVVNSPAINTRAINRQEYLSQLQYWIDRYRLAGKTYIIKLDQ